MKILVYPRDPNPYQALLYRELEELGAQVGYLGRLTPSRTLNLLLLPLETAVRRASGARLIHVHWVFGFRFPGSRRLLVSRCLAQAWFGLWLRTARLLGLRLTWTAHNVLPHSPVFADDEAGRRILVSHCDLVFAHSPAALDGLAALGAVPRRSMIIRHGPIGPATPASLRVPGSGDGPRRFLFVGKIEAYKGVDDLLAAFGRIQETTGARLTIAGQCRDRKLRMRLQTPGNVCLRLGYIPAGELTALLAEADAVVLPFRHVTTSGTAELALAHGRPLVVPDLPGLAGLPAGAVTRYDGSVGGLACALAEMAHAGQCRLAAMSAAALRYSAEASWPQIASATMCAMKSVVSGAAPDRTPERKPPGVSRPASFPRELPPPGAPPARRRAQR
jgi:glycosyltransferase involved in cell wall biosynthesis